MVDIDRVVCELALTHLKQWSEGVGEDPRFELFCEDAKEYLEKDETTMYDVIIADLTDPVGPATTVYQESFINGLKARLAPGGVMAMQAESAVNLCKWHEGTKRLLGACFNHVEIYHQYVQMYGGLWAFALCADWDVRSRLGGDVVMDRMNERAVEGLRMYSPACHAAMFEGFDWVG